MKSFLNISTEIGYLVTRKNAAYGSSFAKAGAALRLLYPQGITPDQMDDALLLARIWDKLQRIATDRDALGESPYRDIAGYGILGAHLHESKRPQGEESSAGRDIQPPVPASGLRESGDGSEEVLQQRMPGVRLEGATEKAGGRSKMPTLRTALKKRAR